MSQKCEKPQGGTSMEAWSTKNGVGENGEDEVAAGLPCRPNFRSHFTPATHIYKTAITSCRITKMPLCASNVDPLTLLTWK